MFFVAVQQRLPSVTWPLLHKANGMLSYLQWLPQAGAAEKDVPLYKHLADLAGNKKLILPVPSFNIINGGSHAGNALAMQVIFFFLDMCS